MSEYVYATDEYRGHWLTGEEIVRCRDCKHATDEGHECKWFIHYEQGASYGWEGVPADVEPDGFCKWGERKDE